MNKLAVFLLLLIPRLCIPASFALAFLFSPIGTVLDAPNWPRRLRDMWDDPI